MKPDSGTASKPPQTARRVVLVTGPSGAGRSSALKVLEDIGFETIDNLPLRLMPTIFGSDEAAGSIALGIDVRNRDFSTDAVHELLASLENREELSAELLFLDCDEEILLRRYSETRRRHPLAPADQPADGIRRELRLLQSVRPKADVLIDTSAMNIHELRSEIERWYAPDGKHPMTVSVQSFSYKRGLPRSVDNVFDCRFLRNPFWEEALRSLNGRDVRVADYVSRDDRYEKFVEAVFGMSTFLLPAYQLEGKSHISIAFGCTGGQHRSVTVAEDIGMRLAQAGWQVALMHRELDRQQSNEAAR